jgi:hypothetical protein
VRDRDLAVQVSGRDANAETLSHKASTPAISATVAHCYRDYLGQCDPATWFGFNISAGKLVTALRG